MLSQTLCFFGIDFSKFVILPRLMKGCFNLNPPRARYAVMWDVSIVLNYLSTLYPVEDLSLKMLTLKLIALMALCSAARAQTLSALDILYMNFSVDSVIFNINQLMKTSRPGVTFPPLMFKQFTDSKLCVVLTLKEYLKRTATVRESNSLFVSFRNYRKVTTCTLARWLKTVLSLAGIDISIFKAHSYRGASTTAAFNAGCSMKDILSVANWSSAKTFYKFYFKETFSGNHFANCVLRN